MYTLALCCAMVSSPVQSASDCAFAYCYEFNVRASVSFCLVLFSRFHFQRRIHVSMFTARVGSNQNVAMYGFPYLCSVFHRRSSYHARHRHESNMNMSLSSHTFHVWCMLDNYTIICVVLSDGFLVSQFGFRFQVCQH